MIVMVVLTLMGAHWQGSVGERSAPEDCHNGAA